MPVLLSFASLYISLIHYFHYIFTLYSLNSVHNYFNLKKIPPSPFGMSIRQQFYFFSYFNNIALQSNAKVKLVRTIDFIGLLYERGDRG